MPGLSPPHRRCRSRRTSAPSRSAAVSRARFRSAPRALLTSTAKSEAFSRRTTTRSIRSRTPTPSLWPPGCARLRSTTPTRGAPPISTCIFWKRRSILRQRSSGRCGSTIKRILIAIHGFRFTRLSWSLLLVRGMAPTWSMASRRMTRRLSSWAAGCSSWGRRNLGSRRAI